LHGLYNAVNDGRTYPVDWFSRVNQREEKEKKRKEKKKKGQIEDPRV